LAREASNGCESQSAAVREQSVPGSPAQLSRRLSRSQKLPLFCGYPGLFYRKKPLSQIEILQIYRESDKQRLLLFWEEPTVRMLELQQPPFRKSPGI
jgi:hypothetical protein